MLPTCHLWTSSSTGSESRSPDANASSPRPSHDDLLQPNGQTGHAQSILQRPNGHLSGVHVIPRELVDSFNEAHFMHILATNPSTVLPPGKSLISVLSKPRAESERNKSGIEKQVESLVHAAFWDEVSRYMYHDWCHGVDSIFLLRCTSPCRTSSPLSSWRG